MLGKFLDPKNDVAFRKVFGSEKNQDILIHLLNDVIIFQENRPIKKVTFLKTVQDPDIASQKTSIVDILCEDDLGCKYIVEMQVAKTTGFEKRAQYYASKAYCSQIHVGGAYHKLKEVIFLAIADYIMFPKKKKYKSDHILLDKETLEHDLKDFSYTFIELPKFTKTIEELNTLTEKWCYFFKYADETSPEDLQKLIGNDKILERVYHELDRFYWTEQELLDYEQAEKARNDYISSLTQSRLEGKEEGIAIGEAKGKAEGKEEGKAEERAKAEQEKAEIQARFAKSLEKKSFSLEEIAEAMGLTLEKVKRMLDV